MVHRAAQPPYGAVSTDGKVLDLPAVYVGLGSEADFAGRDVRGKAVLCIRSQFTYNVGPTDVLKRAEDHGAAAILVSDLRGGNFNVQAYRVNTTLPSFNLGTEDALAVRSDCHSGVGRPAAHKDSPRRQMGIGSEIVPGVGHAAGRHGRNDLCHCAPRWLVRRCR
jgi:hypothetical protein